MTTRKVIRLTISTIIGFAAMLTLFYGWHGIVLNDFSSLQYNPNIYLWLLFSLYLIVALALSLIISIYIPRSNRFLKHTSIGVFAGFLIYLTAFVLGTSFSNGRLEHVIIDFIWQMIEQGTGAAFISIYYSLVYRYDKLKKMKSFD